MYVADWSPPEGAVDVPVDATIKVTFSDYPDPDTIGEPSMLLTTGVFRLPRDLSGRPRRQGGDDGAQRGARHRSRLHGDGHGQGRVAGRLLRPDRRATVHHRGTGEQHPTPAAPQLAKVQAIFDASCAGSSCHINPSGGCLPAPYGGLSLCAAEARDALVDVPSREVGSLALVAPLDSARSYLLRKLLPATAGGGPIPGTLGQREPPGPAAPGRADSDHRSLDRRWRPPVRSAKLKGSTRGGPRFNVPAPKLSMRAADVHP